MRKLYISVLSTLFSVLCSLSDASLPRALAKEIALYDFEKDPQGWNIPEWAMAKSEYVGEEISVSEFHASRGKYSLEFKVNFRGGRAWNGAYVECPIDVQDWSGFRNLEVDVCLPKEAPRGLRAKLILTVGPDWKWVEMNKALKMEPGEWTVIKVGLTPESMNWKTFMTEEFRQDVKKIGVRVESSGGIVYKGPVYIDNVKLSE